MTGAIRGVLLDAGGTITFPRAEDLGPVLRRHGHEGEIALDQLLASFYATVRELDNRNGEGDGVWWWTTWLRTAGVALPVAAAAAVDVTDGGLPWVGRLSGALEGIRLLREAGMRIAIVSNAFGGVADELATIGVAEHVDVIIDSHLVGVAKPNPAIFQLALDGIGLEPHQAIHVGDVYSIDVLGALAAGVRPIHVDPFGHYDHEHSRIRSLIELAQLVQDPPGRAAPDPQS